MATSKKYTLDEMLVKVFDSDDDSNDFDSEDSDFDEEDNDNACDRESLLFVADKHVIEHIVASTEAVETAENLDSDDETCDVQQDTSGADLSDCLS